MDSKAFTLNSNITYKYPISNISLKNYNSNNSLWKKTSFKYLFCVRLGIEINGFMLDSFFFSFSNLCVWETNSFLKVRKSKSHFKSWIVSQSFKISRYNWEVFGAKLNMQSLKSSLETFEKVFWQQGKINCCSWGQLLPDLNSVLYQWICYVLFSCNRMT